LIIDLRDRFGISVVIATHDLDLAARIADRVCLVKRGSVFAEGTPSEIFYDADLIQEAGLRLPATVATYLDYCKRRGITPDQRPLRREDLVGILAGTI
jgi:cobalt/nickel transport system ATP-binding protein